MKSLKLLLLLPALFSFTYAQPTLTAANAPQNGDVFVRRYLDMQSINLGPPGSNITWDYSGAVYETIRDSGQYMAAIPPQSNIWHYNQAYRFTRYFGTSSQATNLYDFYISTPDSLSRAGMDHDVPDFHPFEYRNAAPLLRFPMTFADTFSESFSGSHQSIAGPRTFTGISHIEADGYGTLILPDSTWNNVLRVHVLDTLEEGAAPFQASSCYYFYHSSSRHPLLVHCPQDLMLAYAWTGKHTGTLTSLEEEAVKRVVTGPNPAHDHIRVEISQPDEHATVRLINLKGQTMLDQKVRSNEKIPVRNLEPGLYFMEITLSGGEKLCRKQLIIH